MSFRPLVLVGDDRQLPEIAAGGAFHALAERLPVSTLHGMRRRHEAWDRQALEQLHSDVGQCARAFRDYGRIAVDDTAIARRAALVSDWARVNGDRLMIATRREDVAALDRELLTRDVADAHAAHRLGRLDAKPLVTRD